MTLRTDSATVMTELYWRPAPTDMTRVGNLALKSALLKRYTSLAKGRMQLDHNSLEYLQGMADAGTDGADTLIRMIEKYALIEIWLEDARHS